jgi:Leucine-rich repeat (LRR) protein
MNELEGRLDLSYKNITSLAGLEYAVNVSDLVLSFNNITDITPILQLSNLRSLYLDYNWLTELPADKTGLSYLGHLDISNNEISEIPAAFFDMPKLRRLYAGDLQLKTPPDLSAVAGTLDRLDISGAKVGDFSFVEGLNNLELLMMNGCGLNALPDLSGMGGLGYLYFTDNEIPALPDYLGSLPLIRLDFSGNLVSGLPQSFWGMKKLEQLVMTDNYFEALPDTVTQMESLEVLMCGQNIISDVPENIGDLKHIKRASFASNSLANLYKFTDFEIPYSYQISFDLNYLDLSDTINMDILDDYHNSGGVQKAARLTAQAAKADTESLLVQCGFDMGELERLGENVKPGKLMLFRRENGALTLVGETDLSGGQTELMVSHDSPPQGTADYLACLVLGDEGRSVRFIKYTAEINGVNIAPAPTAQPTQTPPMPTESPAPAPSAEPSEQKGVDSKILLYILLMGVIIIIIAIVIYFVSYRRK